MKKKIALRELLNMVPEEFLDKISEETQVDHQVKKLTGKVIFKLFLYGLSSQKELSWRILETIFSHYKFLNFANLSNDQRADHSSLATRISNINVDYFKKIHEALNKEILSRFAPKQIGGYQLVRFDSTMVSIAGTLLKKINGLQTGVNKSCQKQGDPVNIKFTIGFDGLSPVVANFFTEQTYLSEEVALKKVIKDYSFKPNEIAVFDRGLNKRDTLDDFTENALIFVTRLRVQNKKVKHKFVQKITAIDLDDPIETKNLWIEKDEKVFLFKKRWKEGKA